MFSFSKRQAGVLLHISALPTGNLGKDAYRFVDFLADVGATVWQTLPLNMTQSDGSPYQSISAHAGNTAFIDFDAIVDLKLLTPDDAVRFIDNRDALLSLAYCQYQRQKNHQLQQQFRQFCRQQAYWLTDFALFLVLRETNQLASWQTWPAPLRNKHAAEMLIVKKRYKQQIAVIKFTQFLFFKQWQALKSYANQKGVYLFGDMPIFVAFDSADVWSNPHLFKLDNQQNMQVVAGVPPDYFSETGQRWGNPHYDWQAIQANDFAWWIERVRTQSQLFDLLRIDHFRGLQAAWEIAASEETAMNGEWVEAPGNGLLKALTKRFKDLVLIAEDLGIITPEVDLLRLTYRIPGMKILQFAFDGTTKNPYLPANIEPNSVTYTGTHDNDTTLGWYLSLDDATRAHVHDALNTQMPNMPQDLIDLSLLTASNLVVIPMQDILGLDGAHRTNVPGTITGNWVWQFNWTQLTDALKNQFSAALKSAKRI